MTAKGNVTTRPAAGGDLAGARLGSRVSRARQEAGLTEKELAIRLGLPLWRIERIQRGEEDPRNHLTEIAETTGKPARWFLVGEESREEQDDAPGSVGRLRSVAKDLTRRLGRLSRRERDDDPATEEPTSTNGDTGLQPGPRVARARQEANLSQKELGELLGVPLWRIERIESGKADASGYLQAIAANTNREPAWFVGTVNGATPEPEKERSDSEASGEETLRTERLERPFRRDLVLASLALLVTIRFFTEIVPVLPRPAKLVDIPILLLLLGVAATVPRTRSDNESAGRYLAPAAVFLLVAMVSILANLDRLAAGPTILFLYGFLAPLGIYVAVYHLWPAGHALSMSRLLVSLAAIEFVVVALIDVPLFLSTHNPDKVSGTFGENAYQLVIFLLVVAAVTAGIYTFEPKRLAARLAPFFFAGILVTIALAQYRAILPTIAATALLIAVLLGFLKLRGAIASILIVVTLVLSVSYVSTFFPELKYAGTVASFTSDPGLYISKRSQILGDVGSLYTDDPRFIITGTGPGTYSSRAWYTFQPSARQKKGIGVQTASGRGYQTDVSQKYVAPRLRRETAESVGGSYAATSPFSSYTSLLAEVGILGFVAMVLVYGGAFMYALRMTIQSLRRPAAGDSLPGLLLGCTAGFFILLQLAVLDNWWEVTRLTFILWTLMAVSTKEFAARYRPETLDSLRKSADSQKAASGTHASA